MSREAESSDEQYEESGGPVDSKLFNSREHTEQYIYSVMKRGEPPAPKRPAPQEPTSQPGTSSSAPPKIIGTIVKETKDPEAERLETAAKFILEELRLARNNESSEDESGSPRKKRRKKPKGLQTKHSAPRTRAKDSWELSDKKLLVEALHKFKPTELDSIAKFVTTKSIEDIEDFIRVCKLRAGQTKFRVKVDSSNIHTWLKLAEDLVEGCTDHSYYLGTAMKIAGDLEEHDPKLTLSDPDYANIYHYLESLLVDQKGKATPGLSQVESAILVDLLAKLKSDVDSMDTSQQARLIQLKHAMINGKVELLRPRLSHDMWRRALEDDLLAEGYEIQRDPETIKTNIPKPTGSQLHCINPFGIPVQYLRPKPRQTAQDSQQRINDVTQPQTPGQSHTEGASQMDGGYKNSVSSQKDGGGASQFGGGGASQMEEGHQNARSSHMDGGYQPYQPQSVRSNIQTNSTSGSST